AFKTNIYGGPFCWWISSMVHLFGLEHDIMQGLQYTHLSQLGYEVNCEMINSSNNHYKNNDNSGWLSCLDEFMIDWLNQCCTVWMCVPWKSHLFDLFITQCAMII
ncbi:hypothetical protein ACHAXS_000601, partial [Conticribra weissflogii]